jgi:predicted anti-sigma-YlaC factor YlaD
MEHEEIVTLMMEALDGELNEDGRQEMDGHLQSCSSCAHQWEALQFIHRIFVQAPIMSPAFAFAQKTVALLPNRTQRIWIMAGIYSLLLISGLIPLVFIGWVVINFGPALNQPAFVGSLLRAGGQALSLIQAIFDACWQCLSNLGVLLSQQPVILGWLLVMVGAVFLWGGVYRQMTGSQRV